METEQNLTQAEPQTSVTNTNVEMVNGVTFAQDQYISFVALGGLIPDPDGAMAGKRMTATELADQLGVVRETLYYWRKSIPDFWDRVDNKRREIGGKDRISNVWNGIYLKASAGNPEAAKLYLANFDPKFRMPTEKVEHDVGNSWAALLENKRLQLDSIPEGNVIDVPSRD